MHAQPAHKYINIMIWMLREDGGHLRVVFCAPVDKDVLTGWLGAAQPRRDSESAAGLRWEAVLKMLAEADVGTRTRAVATL
jgi:hypothetical protein